MAPPQSTVAVSPEESASVTEVSDIAAVGCGFSMVIEPVTSKFESVVVLSTVTR